jgi:hypothetical protein
VTFGGADATLRVVVFGETATPDGIAVIGIKTVVGAAEEAINGETVDGLLDKPEPAGQVETATVIVLPNGAAGTEVGPVNGANGKNEKRVSLPVAA